MKKFKVVCGLGRMVNHHRREYVVEAKDRVDALSVARYKYYPDVEAEIGKKDPIFGKMLHFESLEEIS